jgi:hypothetical protein
VGLRAFQENQFVCSFSLEVEVEVDAEAEKNKTILRRGAFRIGKLFQVLHLLVNRLDEAQRSTLRVETTGKQQARMIIAGKRSFRSSRSVLSIPRGRHDN